MDKVNRNYNKISMVNRSFIQVKSKYLAEFRRFPVDVDNVNFDEFFTRVATLHRLAQKDYLVTYTDPVHGDLLPINNDENFNKAKQSCLNTLMRVYVHKKDNLNVINGFGQSTIARKKGKKAVPRISFPEDFRPVSAIIDVDILPETLRRVRLHNHGVNKPLGFFIRDGVSLRMSDNGVEKVPGIFISRLVQGGLAEMTGLLAVNDEVLEVNGIEVHGKSLDQVTDMMVANSSNLIITVKPESMRNAVGSVRSRTSDRPPLPAMSRLQAIELDDVDDGDVVKDLSSVKSYSSNKDTYFRNPSPAPSLDTGSSPSLARSSELISAGKQSPGRMRKADSLKKARKEDNPRHTVLL